MNILHMKYAVEVARSGSLSKAAEVLFIAQPNLSKAIRDLEAELGITIFERTAKGMIPTAQGQDFLRSAERILREIRDLDNLYKFGAPERQRFAISVPRASYIAIAFSRFSTMISKDEAEIFYMETNAGRAIHNLIEEDYRLGVIRTSEIYEPLFVDMFREKNISYRTLVKFRFRLIFSKDSPLAKKDVITHADLEPLIEIAHADPYVPTRPMLELVKDQLTLNIRRRIFVFERASAFDMLSRNPETFMWISPVPKDTMVENRFGLTEREYADNGRVYEDILIYRDNYKFSDTDVLFIETLENEIANTFGKQGEEK